MRHQRRSVAQFVLALHLCFTLAAVALVGQQAIAELSCTCAHTGAQQCPMHHSAASEPRRTCRVRSATDDNITFVATLLGPLAPHESVCDAEQLTDAGGITSSDSRVLLELAQIPVSPPPRA